MELGGDFRGLNSLSRVWGWGSVGSVGEELLVLVGV